MTELIGEDVVQALSIILMYLICCVLFSVVLTWAQYLIAAIIAKQTKDVK